MSQKAFKWDGVSPLTAAAQHQWRARGFMFGGAPPMDTYYPREWLVALAAILGKPLEVADLRELFRVKKESETLGCRRHKRVVFYMFGDQHAKLLAHEGIAVTVRRRDDVLVSSILVPVSKFNQTSLVDTLTRRHGYTHVKRREWPRKRDVVPMGFQGPGGTRKSVRGQLHQHDLRPPHERRGPVKKHRR